MTVLVVSLFAGQCHAQATAAPAGPPKLQALIITGQNGHDWRATTPVLKQALEETGRFEVRVTEEFRGAGPETLAPYDVVIINYFDEGSRSFVGESALTTRCSSLTLRQGFGRVSLLPGGIQRVERVRKNVGRQLAAGQWSPLRPLRLLRGH